WRTLGEKASRHLGQLTPEPTIVSLLGAQLLPRGVPVFAARRYAARVDRRKPLRRSEVQIRQHFNLPIVEHIGPNCCKICASYEEQMIQMRLCSYFLDKPRHELGRRRIKPLRKMRHAKVLVYEKCHRLGLVSRQLQPRGHLL